MTAIVLHKITKKKPVLTLEIINPNNNYFSQLSSIID